MWIGSSNVAVTCSGCLVTTLPSAGYVAASAACANRLGAEVAARAGDAAATPSPIIASKPAITAAASFLGRRA